MTEDKARDAAVAAALEAIADRANHWEVADAVITAYEATRGNVVAVPNVPTRAMIDAWRTDQAQGRSLETSYRAMIAASQGER